MDFKKLSRFIAKKEKTKETTRKKRWKTATLDVYNKKDSKILNFQIRITEKTFRIP